MHMNFFFMGHVYAGYFFSLKFLYSYGCWICCFFIITPPSPSKIKWFTPKFICNVRDVSLQIRYNDIFQSPGFEFNFLVLLQSFATKIDIFHEQTGETTSKINPFHMLGRHG